MKKLLLILLFVLAIFSCSKDDGDNAPQNQNGGDIFTAQIVTIHLPGQDIPATPLEATLGGEAIEVTKTDNHEIMFIVPQTTPGQKDLIISSLGTTIHYNVLETVLPGTPEETLAPMFTEIDEFAETLPGSESPEALNMINTLSSFDNYLANATAEDKMQLAIAYAANKELIDTIIASDFSNITGRITWDDKLTLLKFLGAVTLIKAGSVMAVKGWHPSIKVLGIVLAGISTTAAIDFYAQFIQKDLKEMGITINTLLGENNRNAMSDELIFTNNVPTTLPIKTTRRKITTADADTPLPLVSDFFHGSETYNTIINNVNTAIQYINEHIPFVSFGLIQTAQLAATSPTTQVSATAETFNKFSFSINHPNLSLVQASLTAEGQMSIRIKINGTPTSLPVVSQLNYTFTDEFSTYTGKFPIKVSNELICGTVTDIDGNVYNVVPIGNQCWTAKNLNVSHYRNGDPIPQIQNDQDWLNATTGAWCYFANNTANGVVYGKLYNWYAVNDPRGLAPEGYHVPSQNEWMQMKDFLGGYTVAGGPLKSTEHWNAPNVGATNQTGFSAVPGSQRNGSFYSDGWGVVGVYWSSTSNPDDSDNEEAWSNTMTATSAGCSHYQGSWKKVGMAVRCVKD